MKTLRINELTEKVITHHKTGETRGCSTGFKCLDEFLSFRKGYSTYFLGFPGHGKTELHLEMLFNLSIKYGWKHAILSAEIGTIYDIVGELVSKHLRKPFFKSSGIYAANEREIYDAMNWINEYFFPIDSDANDFTIDTFYEYCKQIETDHNITLSTTSIDPWNDLQEDLTKHGNREDKYLASALKKVRQSAKTNNWHNMIVTHAKEIDPIALKDINGTKVNHVPMPTLGSFAGGMVWGRRAFNVVGVWRPEVPNLINPNTGCPFAEDEAIIRILKAKPKGSAKKGYCSLFYDWKKNRYYEKDPFRPGVHLYAFDHEKVVKTEPEIKHEFPTLEQLDEAGF